MRLLFSVNPFVPNAPFSLLLENIRTLHGFLMLSGGKKKGALRTNGLMKVVSKVCRKKKIRFKKLYSGKGKVPFVSVEIYPNSFSRLLNSSRSI